MRNHGNARSTGIAAALAVMVASLAVSPAALGVPILYFVDSTGDGGNVGSATNCDDGTGHCTLRAAMEAANANPGADGIFFSLDPSTDPNCDATTGQCTITLTVALPDISEGVEIDGPGANLLTVDADYRKGLRVPTTDTVTLSGLTIAHGNGGIHGDGGGITHFAGTLNVNNCTITGSTAADAAGILNSGLLNLTNSTISDNKAFFSCAGVTNREGGTVAIVNSTISGNTADEFHEGGGICNADGGTVTITNSTITGNSAQGGGGILNQEGSAVTISNSTITGNSGIFAGGGIDNGGIAIVKSSIITGNSAFHRPDVSGVCVSQGFNLVGPNGQFAGFTEPTDLIGVDPKFDPNGLQDNGGPTKTIALLCGSQAIDQGTSIGVNGALAGDQRSLPRIVDDSSIPNAAGGDGADIGAVETSTICGDCQITCPADIDQDNQPDSCAAKVDYPPPTVSSSFCPTTCSFPPGFYPVGTTTVTCHTTIKECSFHITVHDTQKPTVTAPPGATVPNDPGLCSATVDPGTASGADNCPAGVTVSGVRSDGQALNAPYPVGTTTITWTAMDASTNTSVPPALQTITVGDAEPPKLDTVTASPSVLWPPNHTMRDVTVDYKETDNCPASSCQLSVVSSEPDNGLGDGDTAPDWLVKDSHHEQLRAERSGLGDGRTYTTTVTCSDGRGNTASKTVDVKVSHEMDGPAGGSLFAAGATVSFTGHFRDRSTVAHSGEWLFDGVRKAATIVPPDSSSTWQVKANTSFKSYGVYTVKMNVTDSSGQTAATSMVGGLDANVVIYPSSGEYVAGGGWIDSPAGAYAANPSLTGKGGFGFVSRSAHTATVSSGETEFDLHLPGFRFNAVNFESQTVSGGKGQFRGTGMVNGAGSYGFVMMVIDGEQAGGGADRLRIRIWNKATGATVYDNEKGSPDTTDPVTPVGSGSSIVIHR